MRVLIAFTLVAAMALITPPRAAASEKVVLGPTEEVLLLPWGVRTRARVDTGAATSSLDARDVTLRGRGRARTVRFTLVTDGGRTILEAPLTHHHSVKSSNSQTERRPTIELEICVAGLRLPAEFTLNDRSGMEHRMLLGRNALAGRFLVDVDRDTAAPAACPTGP